ncbi:MAG TPA: permease [Chloroflexi bacterium]|jgi:uncharacterized membrane protein YraQ (UPF0718 family)|nr:permease [Chloroflexota bacterium]
MSILQIIGRLTQEGLGSLAAYLAAHVLLCLLPAFFIAGALSALVPREAVTRYLGRTAPKTVSYPAAALGGFVLAVCSCTILPLFAGIYKKGAGLGPAITFLFVGPAISILAFSYTGVALGMDIAVARLALSIMFGIGIGLIMATIFRDDDVARESPVEAGSVPGARVPGKVFLFLGLLLALLIVGTLQVDVLTKAYAHVTLPIPGMDDLQAALDRLVPFDAARGEEGVSVQGAFLIGLLGLIGVTAWKGLTRIDEGYNRWTWVSLSLIALTLVVAATRMVPYDGRLQIELTGKMLGVIIAMAGLWWSASRLFDPYEIQEFLWETWRFVRQIFPLLVVGVFVVGVIHGLVRPEWIQALAGTNSVIANAVGVLFGVFMYFPTLVEVPIANLFLSLGMHRGPLLAYLIADPVLSLQSTLVTASIIGKLKAWMYVAWVAVFSVVAGLLYGAWVDGASILALLSYLAAASALLTVSLVVLRKREAQRPARLAKE